MWNRLVFSYYWLLARLLVRMRPRRSSAFTRWPKNILVISAAGIGDSLTDSPAIRALKESFPEAGLAVLAHHRRVEIARHNPYVDRIYPYRKGLFAFWRLVISLRREGFDRVVILRANDPDIWPLAYLVNRDAVVSNPIMTRMKFLISHPARTPNWYAAHGVDQTLDIAQAAGATRVVRQLVYQIQTGEEPALERILIASGWRGEPIVSFHMGGTERLDFRDWPAGHYIQLGNLVGREFDLVIALTGGKDKKEKGKRVARGMDRPPIDFCGRLSLPLTAALLARSSLVVTTVSGIMHLAFAVGTPTLILSDSRESPDRLIPPEEKDKHHAIRVPLRVAGEDHGMEALRPEEGYSHLTAILERRGIVRSGAGLLSKEGRA